MWSPRSVDFYQGATQAPSLVHYFSTKVSCVFSIFPISLGKNFIQSMQLKCCQLNLVMLFTTGLPKSHSVPWVNVTHNVSIFEFLFHPLFYTLFKFSDFILQIFSSKSEFFFSYWLPHNFFFYLLFYFGHIDLQHMRIATTFACWNFLLFSSLTLLITTYFHLQKIKSFNYPRAFPLSNLCCPWPIWRDKPWEQGCQLYVQQSLFTNWNYNKGGKVIPGLKTGQSLYRWNYFYLSSFIWLVMGTTQSLWPKLIVFLNNPLTDFS